MWKSLLFRSRFLYSSLKSPSSLLTASGKGRRLALVAAGTSASLWTVHKLTGWQPFPPGTFIHVAHTDKPPSKYNQFNFIADVVEKVTPAVVSIELVGNVPLLGSQHLASGSGVIVKSDGWIITNAHVVGGGHVGGVTVKLHDGRVFRGVVRYVDEHADLAVVKIPSKDLPSLKLDADHRVRPGEWVIALGSPLSLSNTVTVGVVSNASRRLMELGEHTPIEYIQTDAMITFGNSGGPLVNLEGVVIGISTMQVVNGISFAVPSDYAKKFFDNVMANEDSQSKRWFSSVKNVEGKPFVGITMLSLDASIIADLQARNPNFAGITHGVLVHSVVTGSPAHRSGVEPGDVIVEANGKPVHSSQDVLSCLGKSDCLVLAVSRRRKVIRITVVPEMSSS